MEFEKRQSYEMNGKVRGCTAKEFLAIYYVRNSDEKHKEERSFETERKSDREEGKAFL